MTKEEFKKEVEDLLPECLHEKSGRILYSDAGTLKKGNIYLLGLNPGGKPDNENSDEWIINNVCRDVGKNAYIDEPWNRYSKGKAPLQKRVCWLLNELDSEKGNSEEESVKKVCVSNLIFKRSRKGNDIGDGDIHNKYALANQCWAVHEFILNIVKPKLIIALGYSESAPTCSYLLAKLDGKEATYEHSNHDSLKLHKFWCYLNNRTDKTLVIGLPHFSRGYNPEKDKDTIKKLVASNYTDKK